MALGESEGYKESLREFYGRDFFGKLGLLRLITAINTEDILTFSCFPTFPSSSPTPASLDPSSKSSSFYIPVVAALKPLVKPPPIFSSFFTTITLASSPALTSVLLLYS